MIPLFPAPYRRPPNALGDLVRVAARLRPSSPNVLARAAAMLGISLDLPAPETSEPLPSPPAPPSTPPAAADRRGGRRSSEDSEAVRAGGDDPRPGRSMTAERLPASPLPPRKMPGTVTELLDALSPAGEPPDRALVGAELFRADHHRAVITALAAIDRPGTELDLPRALDLLARRQPIDELPLAPARTTRTGLHLLLDMGPSMRPFLRDLRLLTERARRVVGQQEVTALRFAGTPNTVSPLPDRRIESAYQPPRHPCAVLVATDLGIGAAAIGVTPASAQEWLAFARTVHTAGCPLVLLVPYPPDRRPDWTSRRFAVVSWDRVTDVGRARRAAGRAAELLQGPR
ncbi:hypothetical protein ACGFX4_37250 [Kitasatospora sp. NPDC048365]|uniref:hypothetical protein n=1 Tax=Kitasatospora sp. NPDC048365 TaxID=3364050 RepID=UPI00371FDDAB